MFDMEAAEEVRSTDRLAQGRRYLARKAEIFDS